MHNGAESAIRTSGLRRSFGSLTAVANLDLNVPRGKVYGFLGPNGAGKTTTIRMLLGLIRPDNGRICLLGRDIANDRASLLGRIGALVETPSLYDHLSGRENLEVTRRLRDLHRDDMDDALRTVGMEEAAGRLVREYSQGMRQRLALALAFIGRPELLILDEPTNGLDPAGIREIRNLICRLPLEHDISVFLSSHLLSEVEQVADSIAVINRGSLVFQGPIEELHARRQGVLSLRVDLPGMALERLHALGHPDAVLEEDGTLLVPWSGDEGTALVNAELVRAGVSVYGLEHVRPSLEDMFMSMTENPKEGGPR